MKTMNPRIEAGLRGAIGSISGVSVAEMKHDLPNSRGRGHVRLDVTVRGWSPSLHVQVMEWRTKCARDVPCDTAVRQALDDLVVEIGLQNARLERGLALGRATPMSLVSIQTEVGHIRIDRGLAEIVATRARKFLHGRPLRSVVAESVVDLHADVVGGRSNRLDNDDTLTDDVWQTMETIAPKVIYDGLDLWLGDVVIPESVAAMAAGMPLGRLVTVPEALTRHVVEEVKPTTEGTNIRISPQLATLDDIERGKA
jgi:hypothetical protein